MNLFEKDSRIYNYRTNRCIESETELYEVDFNKMNYIFELINKIIRYSSNSFYGFQLLPDGKDCDVFIRLSVIGFEESIFSLFKGVQELKITPIDRQFLLSFKIKNAFILKN